MLAAWRYRRQGVPRRGVAIGAGLAPGGEDAALGMATRDSGQPRLLTIGEHLEELRAHLLRALVVTVALFGIALALQDPLMAFVVAPHRRAAEQVAAERLGHRASAQREDTERLLELAAAAAELERAAAALGERVRPDSPAGEGERLELARRYQEAALRLERLLPPAPPAERLLFLRYQDAFLAYMKLALIAALLVAAPYWLWELWRFVAEGLEPAERAYVRTFAPISLVCLLLAAGFTYFVLLPVTLRYLLAYGGPDLMQAGITIDSYLGLFFWLHLGVAATFQLPVVLVFGQLAGLLDSAKLRSWRRYFIAVAFLVAAIVTPTGDPLTMTIVALPMLVLYELGPGQCGLDGAAPPGAGGGRALRLGIAGPPQAGKTTLFTVLTGEPPGSEQLAGRTAARMVQVPDPRLEHLREVFRPRSYKPASFQAVDYGAALGVAARTGEQRTADALLVVLPAFGGADPEAARGELEVEWAVADLEVVERRLERLRKAVTKPTPSRERDLAELALLERLAADLGAGRRPQPDELEPEALALLRPFGLLTLKPRLWVRNVGEEALPYPEDEPAGVLTVCGRLEAELACLSPGEQGELLELYGIAEPARARLIRAAFALLGLISFFTVGEDEVRAWTVPAGTPAPRAAGAVHSDMERGFIRAEVTGFADFVAAGSSLKACRAAGTSRLEGREYAVQDGDIVEFRFSV
ncbi:MAG: hypothetical protein KatS3mg102_2873 [Planctomycetota bacterium]|nr:MAG: hypothetical protein KatS3mg102_2873 [Planctomycetota bacterium]